MSIRMGPPEHTICDLSNSFALLEACIRKADDASEFNASTVWDNYFKKREAARPGGSYKFARFEGITHHWIKAEIVTQIGRKHVLISDIEPRGRMAVVKFVELIKTE